MAENGDVFCWLLGGAIVVAPVVAVCISYWQDRRKKAIGDAYKLGRKEGYDDGVIHGRRELEEYRRQSAKELHDEVTKAREEGRHQGMEEVFRQVRAKEDRFQSWYVAYKRAVLDDMEKNLDAISEHVATLVEQDTNASMSNDDG